MKKLILILPLVAASFACQNRDQSDTFEQRERAAETYQPSSDAIAPAPGSDAMDYGTPSTSGTFQNDTTSPPPASTTPDMGGSDTMGGGASGSSGLGTSGDGGGGATP
jgi:hypothetical protein